MKDSTKKFLKGVLIFAAGAALGALVAYEITRHKYESAAEMEYFPDDIADRLDEYTGEEKDQTGPRHGKLIVIPKDSYKKTIKDLGYDRRSDKVDPAELESPQEDSIDEDVEDYYKNQKLSIGVNNNSGDEPHIITNEEFDEEMAHYDKVSLTFYEDDQVLTDETEEIIDDPVSILGEDALESFGIGSEDPEVVYVRNDNLQIDYEIIRLSKSYKETVLGDIEGSGDNE